MTNMIARRTGSSSGAQKWSPTFRSGMESLWKFPSQQHYFILLVESIQGHEQPILHHTQLLGSVDVAFYHGDECRIVCRAVECPVHIDETDTTININPRIATM